MKFEDKHFNLLETSYHEVMSTINEFYKKGIPLTDSLMKSEKEVTDAIDEALAPYYEAKNFLSDGFGNFKFCKKHMNEDPSQYKWKKQGVYDDKVEIYLQIVESWEQGGELITEEDIKEYEAEIKWTDKDWREHYGFDEDDENPDWDSVSDDWDN